MKVIVTGAAGFIGFHLARRLLHDGHEVVGIDAFTPYYDVGLKEARAALLAESPGFRLVRADIADGEALDAAFDAVRPEVVHHLAAQAGVRYSITNPDSYIASNLVGTYNVLAACRRWTPRHLLLASTSSVYGGNEQMPFTETDKADLPLTLYAATKKSGEAMAHSYAHLFEVPTTALRFFTVYGPWGRPDMALFKFVRAIAADEPIEVFNRGHMSRDFTYVDDLVDSLVRLAETPPDRGRPAGPFDTLSPVAPFRVVNIGGGAPISLGRFIELIETAVGKKAKRVLLPMQEGDVPCTYASNLLLETLIGASLGTPVHVGIARFVSWYREYHGLDRPLVHAAE